MMDFTGLTFNSEEHWVSISIPHNSSIWELATLLLGLLHYTLSYFIFGVAEAGLKNCYMKLFWQNNFIC